MRLFVAVLAAALLGCGAPLAAGEKAAQANVAPVAATAAKAAPEAAPAAAPQEMTIDWLEEIYKGGLTSLALVLLSAAAVGFAAERFFNLRAKYLAPAYYPEFFRRAAATGNVQALEAEAEKRPSVIATLGAYLAKNSGRDLGRVALEMDDLAGREFERHRQRSYPLAIIATMAPMLGLLGTMVGMIEAFQKVAILGDTGDASVLAESIGKALITTAVGLVLAIPALGCYHYLKSKIALAELRVEEMAAAMVKSYEPGAAGERP